ncbi:hypothetical protein ACIQ7Q_00370 [Streptomyces sp. NPDC096176]|uniref:hypothetical protein n=1 Tax=Streptomyces sp. NPDC096176 TaxID=3366079 RepID=UPI0037FD1EF6
MPESIRRFTGLTSDFTEESGHLTPSLKHKRSAIARDFEAEIESLCAGRRDQDNEGLAPERIVEPEKGRSPAPYETVRGGAPWVLLSRARSPTLG